jgi:Contact-dependent growth inhibition CdiA C-terminal domain
VKGGVEAAKASKEIAQGTKATKNVVKATESIKKGAGTAPGGAGRSDQRVLGSLNITAKNASVSEVRAANYMKNKGFNVKLRDPLGTRVGGGTSDLLVDGITYDVYTPLTANPNAIISAIAKKNTQASGIVLDLSNTSVTQNQLGNILKRVQRAGATSIRDIQIIERN